LVLVLAQAADLAAMLAAASLVAAPTWAVVAASTVVAVVVADSTAVAVVTGKVSEQPWRLGPSAPADGLFVCSARERHT
jgi:hypothetical protein